MSDRTLYEWFTASALATPAAPALEAAGHTLTYGELHAAATALAARIRQAYDGVPARVALLAGQGPHSCVGYLAALRLGAAVTPLNPGYPAARNRSVCDLARIDVLLADPAGRPQLEAELAGAGVLTLLLTDEDVTGAGPSPDPELERLLGEYRGRPDDLAYVLFTSGSTGRPKGVPITHRNVSPYVEHNRRRYAVGPGCRMSHTFDLTFDPSVFDLFVTWAGGATLCVPSAGDLLTPIDYVVERRITHWFSVPSVVSVAVELSGLPENAAGTLRHSTFIGEQLTLDQARAWHRAAPGSAIDNVYGPTELTVACSEYTLPARRSHWPRTANGTVPIGEIYAFLDHLVIDENGHPAAEGELCVRGSQRFGGYLDPADDTGRFLAFRDGRAEPYDGRTPLTPAHYYRTGDRVRQVEGALLHLGRLDNQVKIRGFRVELGEIEAALRAHPGVGQAIVLALGEGEGTELVAAYTGDELADRDVRRWLRRRLPLHMVPRRLHRLEAVPLNANGKADRGHLRRLLTTS
ncbi:amino acid adenylation domain-containing protein [Kineosporia sp. J2-2]|uniref:Amino acid adenylation domain-containing protein n=1 Tax=Kineosporia corallincola TaxID=2835133 RepID=A0ABS5TMN7_9ACTN|nr:amino acid adenylation domain-containing protein [Kineosporia corallincola]MBT0772356.1 amino acid adenylation domain-containing protein [Kineosporia corallincola]